MNVRKLVALLIIVAGMALTGCAGGTTTPAATPTVDPDIFNQVPTTTVFEPGQCVVVLDEVAPAYLSNEIGGQASGEVAAGSYEVGVVADYGSSAWYMLNGMEGANFINSASVTSTEGDCSIEG